MKSENFQYAMTVYVAEGLRTNIECCTTPQTTVCQDLDVSPIKTSPVFFLKYNVPRLFFAGIIWASGSNQKKFCCTGTTSEMKTGKDRLGTALYSKDRPSRTH